MIIADQNSDEMTRVALTDRMGAQFDHGLGGVGIVKQSMKRRTNRLVW